MFRSKIYGGQPGIGAVVSNPAAVADIVSIFGSIEDIVAKGQALFEQIKATGAFDQAAAR